MQTYCSCDSLALVWAVQALSSSSTALYSNWTAVAPSIFMAVCSICGCTARTWCKPRWASWELYSCQLNTWKLKSVLIIMSLSLSLSLQSQYVYLHQCVRDVLRARKLRCEQENPLYPIYENFNPDYFRGESPFHHTSCIVIVIHCHGATNWQQEVRSINL